MQGIYCTLTVCLCLSMLVFPSISTLPIQYPLKHNVFHGFVHAHMCNSGYEPWPRPMCQKKWVVYNEFLYDMRTASAKVYFHIKMNSNQRLASLFLFPILSSAFSVFATCLGFWLFFACAHFHTHTHTETHTHTHTHRYVWNIKHRLRKETHIYSRLTFTMFCNQMRDDEHLLWQTV